jgi:tryptophan-rich sensory protein
MKIKSKTIWLFIISLAIPLVVGYLGSLLTTPSISTWYQELYKPSFTPPNWVFAPAWTTLFILMGVACFLILRDGKKNRYFRSAYLSYGAQLFLNIYWSFLFFYIKEPPLAFYAIISLWSMIFVNIYYFYQIKKTAAYLLIPYIVWVTFAAVLNYSIWLINTF